MHASAFLVPERPIAEIQPFCLNSTELRSFIKAIQAGLGVICVALFEYMPLR
jgi:hypothetical protein